MPQTSSEDDYRAIKEVVLRYCRGIDRLDVPAILSAYHEDGIDHHTGYSGPAKDFVEWCVPLLAQFGGTMHMIGNHLAEISGNTAVVETYGSAIHWGDPPDDPRQNFTTGFRYIDHMEKRDGRWAIAERWAVREWTRSDAGRYIPKEADGPSPRKDGNDPLQLLQRKLGIGV